MIPVLFSPLKNSVQQSGKCSALLSLFFCFANGINDFVFQKAVCDQFPFMGSTFDIPKCIPSAKNTVKTVHTLFVTENLILLEMCCSVLQ